MTFRPLSIWLEKFSIDHFGIRSHQTSVVHVASSSTLGSSINDVTHLGGGMDLPKGDVSP